MEEIVAVTRHCAYCLNLRGFKLCGGCKKRAYCSKKCQAADWSSRGNGQGHVNWCRKHECGEEDVDWEVVPIPNKGLGVRAKKIIPSGMKMIVEPVFSSRHGHPGINDLGPDGQSLERKFFLNTFLGENAISETLAVRIARVNHSCQPNAATIYDETAHVAILFAQKDILPNKEISICYYPLFFVRPLPEDISRGSGGSPGWNFEQVLRREKNRTLNIHGILCTSECSCNDPAISNLVQEARQIFHSKLFNLTISQNQIEETLAAGEKLLDIHGRLNISWVDRALAQYVLFQIAITKSEYLPRAMQYMRSSLELYRKMVPYSEQYTKKLEKLLEHPEMHLNYLTMDRTSAMSDLG